MQNFSSTSTGSGQAVKQKEYKIYDLHTFVLTKVGSMQFALYTGKIEVCTIAWKDCQIYENETPTHLPELR